MVPLSVISCSSIEGGRSSRTARCRRVELSVLVAAKDSSRSRKTARTSGRTSTSAGGACSGRVAQSLRQTSIAGKKSAVGPGNNHVLSQHSEMRQESHTQGTNTDPCAARKLEILVQPAVKEKSLYGVVGIQKANRIAQAIVVFFVKGGRVQISPAPKPRCNRRPTQTRFEFFLNRNELQFDARDRQPNMARRCTIEACRERVRRTFRGAQASDDEDLLPAGFEGEVLQVIPDVLAEAGCGEEKAL